MSSSLDTLVADERNQVVNKRRREIDEESIRERQEILTHVIERFKLGARTFDILKHCSAEPLLSLLCVLVSAKEGISDERGQTMPLVLCEWFAEQAEGVRSFPLRVTGFSVSKNYFELLKDDPSVQIRILMAEHPCVPSTILLRLRADQDLVVQKAAMANPCIPLAR